MSPSDRPALDVTGLTQVLYKTWDWTLYEDSAGAVSLLVVCGSGDVWEEWADLDQDTTGALRAALDIDDDDELADLAEKAARRHKSRPLS